MYKLLTTFLMLIAFSCFAQSQTCALGHHHKGDLGCGITDPDSTITIMINSVTEQRPIEAVGLVKDGLVFIEGGILVKDLNKPETRGLSCHICGKWPDGKIPYEIDASAGYSSAMLNSIHEAIEELNTRTNIQIVPRTDEVNFVRIKNGNGCYSMIGNKKLGAQTLSLKEPGCGSLTTIMHEFLHAAGVLHEQSREDRNSHVDIHLENVIAGMESNFNQYLNVSTDVGEYDKSSIMHYNSFAFSKNGQPTITNKDGSTTNIGPSSMMTSTDIESVNLLYSSPSPVEFGKVEVVDAAVTGVEIRWTTHSEINSEGFYLQRSIDAVRYEDVAFVFSQGYLNQVQTYTARDSKPHAGMSYYRLRQVDNDGEETHSDVLKVRIADDRISVYPSMVLDKLHVRGTSIQQVEVFNASGHGILLPVQDGVIDVVGLSKGIYMIHMGGSIHKFVKI